MTGQPLTASSYRFAAAAHRHAAGVFERSPSEAQRAFAPVLHTWAANADARADHAERLAQPDLFGERE